jgi:Fe-S-cluster-containing hydrogenase component 2
LEGKFIKCNLCGGDPECVRFCIPEVLKFVEAEKAVYPKEKLISEKLMEIYKGVKL